MSAADATRAHAAFPELKDAAAALNTCHPPGIRGVFVRSLPKWNVRIVYVHGDVTNTLPGMDFSANAWFLDGFAPSSDAGIWQPSVYEAMAANSSTDATVATFTSAGHVRRGLAAVGFDTRRVDGFGRKRHMITGVRDDQGHRALSSSSPSSGIRNVHVIGAGLAGCHAARVFAERGCNVTVFERNTVAAGASAHERIIMEPVFMRREIPAVRLRLTAFDMVRESIEARTGVLHLDVEGGPVRTWFERLQPDPLIARWCNEEEVATLVGARLGRGGLFAPGAGWSNGRRTCESLLHHPRIATAALSPRNAFSDDCDFTVVAAPGAARSMVPSLSPHLLPVRGEVHWRRPQGSIAGSGMKTILSAGAAIFPPDAARGMLIASTFDPDTRSTWLRAGTGARLDALLAERLGNHATRFTGTTKQAWAGTRWTTRDRMPAVGLVEDGIGVSLAHGSRGGTGAAWAADLLAARVFGGPAAGFTRDIGAVEPERLVR